MKSLSRVLIDGPAWIGDMVMAQTLFKLLKQRHPQASLDVLAPAWTQPLLERMPEVARAIALPFNHGELQLRQRYKFAKTLREHGYDQAILLRNSLKSALIPYWAQIKHRTGWLGELRYGLVNDWRRLNKNTHPSMAERFMALALEEGATLPTSYAFPRLEVSAEQVQTALYQHGLQRSRPILALCAGAEYGPAKRWPAEYFAEIANAKMQAGWQVWLFGSEKDKSITRKINLLCDEHCVDLAGKTSLAQAIDLLSLAQVVVTNDSGLMHIAAALGCVVIALYGSSSPEFTPPLAEKVSKLSLNLACSPCFQRECPLGHLNCLQNLRPLQVLQAIDSHLSQCAAAVPI